MADVPPLGGSPATCSALGARKSPALACLLAVAACGCAGEAAPTADAPAAPPTAEERFERIVRTLEDRLEDGSLNAASAAADAAAAPGSPVTDATVRVSHEVFPRSSEGAPQRAKVCITTKAKVLVALPSETEEEKEEAKKEELEERERLEKELDGIADLDSLKIPKSDGLAGRLGSSSVHEINQGDVQRCFELEYREGKWELLTELDRENEPFNALAIEYALRKQ